MKIAKAVAFLAVICALVFAASRQAGSQQSQIVQPINSKNMVVLKGNVHPWARAQFDRGPAPATLPLDRMMLVLKSTPEQIAQLHELLKEQQDPTSPNYHKWLTPDQFGSRFGASEADIQKITSWLASQGFQIDMVAKGRNLIEFSGNAGQVQATFRAAIHKYVIAGKQYWANANDPAIPAALTPAIAGIASLNNFPRNPSSRFAGNFTKNKAGKLVRKVANRTANPQFTYAGGCNGSGTNCYALTPSDFAAIYNVQPLWNANINGSGQTIAIVSDSDINKADFTNFRSVFGLPAGTLNVIYTPGSSSSNPGVQSSGNESEADVDTQWAGAVAPGATIDLVVSADNPQSTLSTFGGDVSAVYVIDGNVSPMPSVLGYSYGLCEFFLGTAGNALYGGAPVKDTTGEWAQAATEGITVVVSTGDNGSTACDGPANTPALGGPCVAPNQNPAPYNDPAVCGLAVNGIASTPYNVAVGGTDFDDGTVSEANNFWNTTNASTTGESVKGYIPEIAYNDSCVNVPLDALYDSAASQDPNVNCNTYAAAAPPASSTSGSLSEFVLPFGGGGGVSDCTTSDATNLSSCSGGYAKPSWQVGTGVPSDGKRDLPDISFFAGDGTFQNFYLYCQQDLDLTTTSPCSLSAGTSAAPFPNIQGVGGTSVSAEVFVGVMALLNQAQGSSGPVGLPNQNLYALAGQSWANCQSSGTLNSGCVFYQVTSGNIAMPCKSGSLDCIAESSSDTVGITEKNGTPAYSAAAGYNMATGLGSLNIYNLVKDWNVGSGGASDFVLSATPSALSVTAGSSTTTTLTVVPVNNFNDTVSFSASSCTGLPTGATCSFGTSPVNANGTTVLTIQTTSASAAPPAAVRPDDFGAWRVPALLALGALLSFAILFFALRGKNRRWAVVAACIVFAAFLGIAGCSGSSSSNSNNPPPPSGAVVPVAVTITGTSTTGQVSRSTTVMLTVN